MVVLILIDNQYPEKAVFSFEKGSNGQNHCSSGSHLPVTPSPSLSAKFTILAFSLHPLPLFGKPWKLQSRKKHEL